MPYLSKLVKRITMGVTPALLLTLAACGSDGGNTVAPASPSLTEMIMTPAAVSLQPGDTQSFAVSGMWSNGATTAPQVSYSATGGTITTDGLYTAGGTAGTFQVIAAHRGGSKKDTSKVTLNPPTLTKMTMTPATASLQTGATQQFAVSGVWSNGATTAPTVNYTATGGTITAGGLYTAGGTAGTFRVIAVQQGGTLADTSSVTLTAPAPTLTKMTMTPATASLQSGGTQQFAVSGLWSNGATTTPAVNYTATGGTITVAGLYTAGGTVGTFRVIAVQQGGTLADTSAVTVTASTSTTLFSEGFEDTNIASRGWFDATNIALATDARPGSTGTHVLQYHWSIGDVAPQGIGTTRHDFTPSNSVYLSYWVKTSANYANVGHQFYFLTTADDHYIGPSVSHLTTYDQYTYSGGNFSASLEIADVLMIDTTKINVDLFGITENRSIAGANGKHEVADATSTVGWDLYRNGSQWMDAKYLQPNAALFTDATKNSWHHIESYEQMNTIVGGIAQQDGVYQYWVDGVLIMDRHNVYFRTGANPTMQFRTFLMGPWVGAGASVDQYVWIDDVVVATAHP